MYFPPIQPLCLIYYNESETDFFRDANKYSIEYHKLKRRDVDMDELKNICDSISNELQKYTCRNHYISDNVYVSIVKVNNKDFDYLTQKASRGIIYADFF